MSDAVNRVNLLSHDPNRPSPNHCETHLWAGLGRPTLRVRSPALSNHGLGTGQEGGP